MSKTTDATAAADSAEPKLGARAERRLADIEKELGKTKAKAVLVQAREIAEKKGDRLVRLEYLFDAQGVKMPSHAKTHYGKKDVTLGAFDSEQAPPKKKTSAAGAGRGNARKASAPRKSSAKKTSARKSAGAKKSSPRQSKSVNGSSVSQSKTAQMRALREQKASSKS